MEHIKFVNNYHINPLAVINTVVGKNSSNLLDDDMTYRSRLQEYNNNNRIAVMEIKLMPREYKMHSTFTIYCTALEFADKITTLIVICLTVCPCCT